MIFVTVGTTKFQFERLMKAVDQAMINLGSGEELIVQTNRNKYLFKYPRVKEFDDLPYTKLLSLFKRARLVITHGGPATIFSVLQHSNNQPIVVPRSGVFGEHVDEHEVVFVKYLFRKHKNIYPIFPNDDHVVKMLDYLKKPTPKSKDYKLVASTKLINKLDEYCHSIK